MLALLGHLRRTKNHMRIQARVCKLYSLQAECQYVVSKHYITGIGAFSCAAAARAADKNTQPSTLADDSVAGAETELYDRTRARARE